MSFTVLRSLRRNCPPAAINFINTHPYHFPRPLCCNQYQPDSTPNLIGHMTCFKVLPKGLDLRFTQYTVTTVQRCWHNHTVTRGVRNNVSLNSKAKHLSYDLEII